MAACENSGHSKNGFVCGPEETGAINVVTSIYLGYRAYDTLGEAIVLFTSTIGIGLLLDRKGGKRS